MKILEQYGINSGSDEQHAAIAEQQIEAQTFFDDASELLDAITPAIEEEVIPNLEEFSGRWNPVGFMVFPLGLHETLGSLRLHFWPRGERKVSAHRPNIHNHAWHLASKVLRGVYRDTLFTVQEAHENETEGTLGVYTSRFTSSGTDILSTSGQRAFALPYNRRLIPAGNVHDIEAGTYHLPNIRADELVATLVVDSPAMDLHTRVLINEDSEEISRQRIVASRQSTLEIKKKLMAAQETVSLKAS